MTARVVEVAVSTVDPDSATAPTRVCCAVTRSGVGRKTIAPWARRPVR
jgi:hypothetical protein